MSGPNTCINNEIAIIAKNIHNYRSGPYPCKRIVWKAGALDAGILQNFPNLEYLYCGFDHLKSLDGLEGCPQLIELDCGYNELTTLDGLVHTPLLRRLICGRNKLLSLKGIECCPLLRHLECISCGLTSLEGIETCPELIYIDCGVNKLQTLTGIGSCIKLRCLICCFNNISTLDNIPAGSVMEELIAYGNHLTVLTGIERCTQLRNLDCNDNRLHTLRGLEACKQLGVLKCSNNRIRSLETIVYLPHLQDITYKSNPLDVQSIQVQRRLGMIRKVNANKSVYNDSQSVHNINVQKCICDSVQRLLKDPEPVFNVEIIIESGMDERAVRLLLEYCDDKSIHSAHLLSFKELLGYVWTRICKSEHKTELIRILGEQMCDSECKCFTGRINRLVSVLAGFDPDVVIEIADSSRIGAIIIAAREQTVPYNTEAHQELAHKLLIEAGYTEVEIQLWLDAITDAD